MIRFIVSKIRGAVKSWRDAYAASNRAYIAYCAKKYEW